MFFSLINEFEKKKNHSGIFFSPRHLLLNLDKITSNPSNIFCQVNYVSQPPKNSIQRIYQCIINNKQMWDNFYGRKTQLTRKIDSVKITRLLSRFSLDKILSKVVKRDNYFWVAQFPQPFKWQISSKKNTKETITSLQSLKYQ